ncbi:hypothetical protein Droror1_Dr00022764 [Drosera rotundifolia]
MPTLSSSSSPSPFPIPLHLTSTKPPPMSSTAASRLNELKQFDETKLGVKGLVDAGISTIPSIFRHSHSLPLPSFPSSSTLIPITDLSGPRGAVIEQIRSAASKFGFFQVVNHEVPMEVMERVVEAVRGFNESEDEVRKGYYKREMGDGFGYSTNVDLYLSKAASWRDTVQVRLGPVMAQLDAIPEILRNEVVEWDREVKKFGEHLMELMCEGLGVNPQRLKEMSCLEGRVMAAHYYPCCPEPDQTIGLASHTDPGVLTVLLQDQVGGLQVLYEGEWLDVKPVPGALVINIGDILQIISNDEYKSGEHRVLANPFQTPRVSIAVFLNPSNRDGLFGPLPELVSPEKPALYRQFTFADFMKKFFTKELDGKSLINFFRND